MRLSFRFTYLEATGRDRVAFAEGHDVVDAWNDVEATHGPNLTRQASYVIRPSSKIKIGDIIGDVMGDRKVLDIVETRNRVGETIFGLTLEGSIEPIPVSEAAVLIPGY